MQSSPARVAMVSMHTSPAASAGTGDAGGMNVLLLAIATELATLGVEVDLITRATTRPAVSRIGTGVTLHELRAGPPGPLPRTGLVAVADEFGEAVANLSRGAGSGYDLIHAHYWLSGIATLPVAIELGLPFVQSFHTLAAMKNRSLGKGQEPESEARLLSEMFLAHQAGAVVAGSAAEVSTLIDDVQAPADKVWVVPPGVDTALFRPDRVATADARLRAELGIAGDRPILAVAGRVQPFKDQDLAIRALAELRAVGGWTPVLVVAGETTPGDDDYLRALKATARELGVSADVRFVGALERGPLADLLAVASVTLVPSRSETFGLIALESAASGTPVVGFRGTGLIESVADGVSGVLLDTRDPADWANTIAELLGDRETLRRLSASARRHAEGCSWEVSATALLGVYAELVAGIGG